MHSLKEFTKKQFVGAETFTITGFKIMDLTLKDVLYEHLVLGIKGMLRGLLLERDPSWILYPYLLLIRVIGYIYVYLKNLTKGRKKIDHS